MAAAFTKEELERLYGVRVLPVLADGGEEGQVKAAVAQIAEIFGRIDALINSAQNSAFGIPLAEHALEDFNKAIYSGLYAAFFYMKHAYPYLKETKGSVVNFASGAGLFGKPGQSSYAAAKEGIQGIPSGRFGDPEKDIGRTAVFLCSEDAKYISGETITMQGGSGLRP